MWNGQSIPDGANDKPEYENGILFVTDGDGYSLYSITDAQTDLTKLAALDDYATVMQAGNCSSSPPSSNRVGIEFPIWSRELPCQMGKELGLRYCVNMLFQPINFFTRILI